MLPCRTPTNADARGWIKDVMRNMIGLGVSGWMADFGTLPLEISLSRRQPESYHKSVPLTGPNSTKRLVAEEGHSRTLNLQPKRQRAKPICGTLYLATNWSP